jgi:hypothetical protein
MEARFTDMIHDHQRKNKEVPDILLQLETEFSDVTRPTDAYEVWFAGEAFVPRIILLDLTL